MAWDALGSIFKKKDQEGTDTLKQNYAPGTGQASAGSVATNPGDYSSFQGQGGSTGGGPVRAGYVNFGTLYDLNKNAAAKQADAVQSKAAGAAADAQAALQGAQGKFNSQASQGTGKGTAGGQHPSKIGTYQETGPGSSWGTGAAPKPIGNTKPVDPTTWTNVNPGNQTDLTAQGSDPDKAVGPTENALGRSVNPSGSISITDTNLDQGVKTDEQSQTSDAATAAANANANRGGNWKYQQLFGNGTQLQGGVGDPRQNENVVSELDAKSGAGQQYTGPDSLKGMMGDDAYAALGEQLRKAQAGTQQLTDEGGLAEALGYGPGAGAGTGNSALDTGLTETAGRQQFKATAAKYKGLSNLLSQAQADSQRAAAGGRLQSDQAAKEWQNLVDQNDAAKAAATAQENVPPEHRKSLHDDSFYSKDTNAGALTQESGYSAQEVEDAWPDLNADERAYLGRGHNVFENITGYGFSGDEATIKANIMAKLAARRAKNGSK